MPKKQRQMGRPTDYSQDLADAICDKLSDGVSLRTICQDESMPDKSTVFRWIRTKDDFRDQYEKAKQESADAMAEETLYIADNPVMGEIRTIRADGSVEIKQDEMLGHRRLQIDTRKWLMAKMKPKKYGDKIDMTTNGKDLPTPILGGLTKKDAVQRDDSTS